VKKKTQPISIERPLLTEVIHLFLRTKKNPVLMKDAQDFFFSFSQNDKAPKCIKELQFVKTAEGMYSYDIEYYLSFINSLSRNHQPLA
jgi:hypothetical protein